MANNKYQIGKEKAREEAMDWQYEFPEKTYTYSEAAEWTSYFRKLGKRYGLLTEFEENGII